MSRRIQVCLTADIEFSIAGTFRDPESASPLGPQNVYCRIGGQSAGLGFMLDTLREHALRATFFVEALNTAYFGDDPMREIACTIFDAGHDVQLHLHPCWTYFADRDWKRRLSADPPKDDFAVLPPGRMREMIQSGLDTFARWGLPRPIALRTGGLHVSRTVYREMAAAGIAVASNVGVGICPPADRTLHFYSGRHRIEGVTEVPVLSYARFAADTADKSLTITGSAWGEIEAIMDAASTFGTSPVVILTHPHEFVVASPDDLRLECATVNRGTQRRLRRLCSKLSADAGRFETVTMRDAAPEWTGDVSADNRLHAVGFVRGLLGALQNRLGDGMGVA